MKIASLLHGFNSDLEERKRSVQRKEVGDVYKKHAKYANASKNPMLQALENLLSGKTEKELHEADAAARKDSQHSLIEEQEESAPFTEEDFTFEMPEKFQKDFNRNPEEQTIFGKDLEKLLFQRTFNNAAQKYSSHIAMVKNGYRSVTEPTFIQVA